MREKNKRTTKCDKSTIKYDVGTIQCVKYNRQMWEKNKGTTKCDKRIVPCNVRITQCENKTIKCE